MNSFALVNNKGESTFARPAPDWVDALSLAANTNEYWFKTDALTASGAAFILFSADGDFYAKKNGPAAIATDVTDGTASELNPTIWSLTAVSGIGFIADSTRKVTLTVYKP